MKSTRAGIALWMATSTACVGRIQDSPLRDASTADSVDAVTDSAGDRPVSDTPAVPDDAACAPPLVACAGRCIDTTTDDANCGGCGVQCAAMTTCTGGACRPICATGQMTCGSPPACVTVLSDPANCGSCAHACASGELCSAGACTTTCAGTVCGRSCVDLQNDPSHCGACGNACPSGRSCASGSCVCNSGTTLCTGACVDTSSSPSNCGACGMACPAGQNCMSGACVLDDVGLAVDDAATVREGETLVYAGHIHASTVARTIHVTVTRRLAASSATPDQNSMRANLFTPGEYIANGTVFTRGVASMPLATNSAGIAAYAPTMPAQYLPATFSSWLVTSLNTVHYNIPIYVVDSTDPAQPYATFRSTDARVTSHPDLVSLTTGRIPLPTYGVPDSIGDRSMAIYDKGTGLMREYFQAVLQSDGSWQFAASGIYQSDRWFQDLHTSNYFMRLTTGTSSVVGMLNPISQIGIAEARAGEIDHALSVTLPNAARGVTSFPASGNDGTDSNPNAPAEGQWFRIDPSVNLDTLTLRPFTRIVARAIQRYGGYGADKNLWCFAFNAEHPINETAAGRPDPWAAGGEIASLYGSIDLNDFPWSLTQWAPVGWNAQMPDAAVVSSQNVVVDVAGTTTVLALDGGDVALPAGATAFTIRVPTTTMNGFALLDTVTAQGQVPNGTMTVSDSGIGTVTPPL